MEKNKLSVLDKYIFGNGRASRKEYWCTFLILIALVSVAVYVTASVLDPETSEFLLVKTILRLLYVIIFASITIRRLHDVGKSGWWYLLVFTIVGIIPIFYWASQKGISTKQN